MPEVLEERRRDVELKDGSVVRLERWALGKYGRLSIQAIHEGYERETAIESVIPEDRPKVEKLGDQDIATIVEAAVRFNYDKDRLKKEVRLFNARAAVIEAMKEPGPSNPSSA